MASLSKLAEILFSEIQAHHVGTREGFVVFFNLSCMSGIVLSMHYLKPLLRQISGGVLTMPLSHKGKLRFLKVFTQPLDSGWETTVH